LQVAGVWQGRSSNPISKISGCGPELGKLPEIWGFLFNIFPKAEASDFKFGTQLGFAKAHHETTPKGKVGVALGYKSSQIFEVSFNISATAVLSS